MIKYCNFTQFGVKVWKLGVLLWNVLFSLFFAFLFHQYRHKYTSNEVKLFFSDRDIVTGIKYINSLFDQNYHFCKYFIVYRP